LQENQGPKQFVDGTDGRAKPANRAEVKHLGKHKPAAIPVNAEKSGVTAPHAMRFISDQGSSVVMETSANTRQITATATNPKLVFTTGE
jgi:hypothetical protein